MKVLIFCVKNLDAATNGQYAVGIREQSADL